MTTQSPASAVITASLRVIQDPFYSFRPSTDAPVDAKKETKTGTEDILMLTTHHDV